MAFEVKDFFMHYTKRGEGMGLFNIAREDPADGLEFYAYQNDEGSFIFQRITTSGTLRIYGYYADRHSANFSDAWTDRATKTYVEYYELFQQDG